MNLYDLIIAKKLSGGGGGGGGGSSFTKIAETEIEANVTSTSATQLTTITLPEDYSDKLLWVSVRDKAGKRTGYYYGSDSIINRSKDAGGTVASNTIGRIGYKLASYGVASVQNSRGIGPTTFDGTTITISGAYNSFDTSTIDGTFHIEVYTLDWPTLSPYA